MTVDGFMHQVESRNPGEPEFLQAVREVVETLAPVVNENPVYKELRILDRLVEPERVVIFRVPWVDDRGRVQVNRGYRVEMNSALGPYKGGLRFHPSVNLGVLKFLAFEQIFKNSLTTLPMGAGKGGADFDPKGRSDGEVMRFCQAFMSELFRHIGPHTDVPAGDIGVGAREVGYLFGQYKKLRNEFTGALTGKGLAWGGSMVRMEATGFGTLYFVQEMLETRGDGLDGKRVAISGSGNAALHAAQMSLALGAQVLTLSDSDGSIHDPDGIDAEKLAWIKALKMVRRGRIREYVEVWPRAEFRPKRRPWDVPVDVAVPAATQNEIDGDDARRLVANGCGCVAEAANMPCDPEAVRVFQDARILYGPGKAANAGGVATSGLEMAQNAQLINWPHDEVEARLRGIMRDIHATCVTYGRESDGWVDYVRGANVAGFMKVAQAMVDQGVV